MTPSRAQLVLQLDTIQHNGLLAMLKAAADAHGLPLSFVVAIASRETNCKNILGDFQGGRYHGVGIMQIDVQHPIAEEARDSGSWKTNPQPLIDWGCELLASNLSEVQGYFRGVSLGEQLHVAAAGYNCGITRAIDSALAGHIDEKTTGHDYGADVMVREAIFASLLREGP